MAKVKCDLSNLVLLENGKLDNEFDCKNVNNKLINCTKCSNGCSNLIECTNVNKFVINQANNYQLNSHLNNHLNSKFKKSQINQQSITKQAIDEQTILNYQTALIKNPFKNSIFFELIKTNKFKENKANLSFPRRFVNVIKKELTEDGQVKNTKKVTKTCVLQPSLFENIPPTVYFGLEDEISMCICTHCVN